MTTRRSERIVSRLASESHSHRRRPRLSGDSLPSGPTSCIGAVRHGFIMGPSPPRSSEKRSDPDGWSRPGRLIWADRSAGSGDQRRFGQIGVKAKSTVGVDVDDDLLALVQPAAQEPHRQRVEHFLLDEPP